MPIIFRKRPAHPSLPDTTANSPQAETEVETSFPIKDFAATSTEQTIPTLQPDTEFKSATIDTADSQFDLLKLREELGDWLERVVSDELAQAHQRIKIRLMAQFPEIIEKNRKKP